MKIAKTLGVVLLLALLVALWAAPFGPVPGVFIGGTQSPIPTDWGDTSNIHEIQLKVSGGAIPRVVVIWVVQVQGTLHVVGSAESGWTKAIGSAAPVELRMQDRTYQMAATSVTSGWEPILQAYIEKYRTDYPDIIADFPSVEDAADTIAVFRLSAPG